MGDEGSANGALRVVLEQGAAAKILRVLGEVDLGNADLFHEQLSNALGKSQPLVVDLSEVSYIDLHGVNAIEDVGLCARAARQEFIVAGSKPNIHKLFSVIQLKRRVHVVESVGDALAFLKQHDGSGPG